MFSISCTLELPRKIGRGGNNELNKMKLFLFLMFTLGITESSNTVLNMGIRCTILLDTFDHGTIRSF